MKPAGEIIDALHKAGATLVIEDGKTRVRGALVPDELLAELKANKVAVLEEWALRQSQNKDRYGEVPHNGVEMAGRGFKVSDALRESVIAYVLRQPRPLHAWMAMRLGEYHALGVAIDDDELAACLDVLAWQRNTTVKLALDWLAGIEESTATQPKSK